MILTCDEKIKLRVPKSGSRMETQREDTKRTSKEAMDGRNKAGLSDIKDTNLGRKVHNEKDWKEVCCGKNFLKSCDFSVL